jgi:Zn-dependent protease
LLSDTVQEIIILVLQIPILFFSIVTHEISHAFMAYKLGDPTAKNAGRLTYNPIKHLDLVGSLVFIGTFILNIIHPIGVVFGWPKPVVVDFRYFRNPRKGMALVAFSGPLANFGLAAAFLLLFFICDWIPFKVPTYLWLPCLMGVFINLLLGCFNLLPIPPLDGSNILLGFLPWRFTLYFYRFRNVGMIILILILLRFGSGILPSLAEKFFALFGVSFS